MAYIKFTQPWRGNVLLQPPSAFYVYGLVSTQDPEQGFTCRCHIAAWLSHNSTFKALAGSACDEWWHGEEVTCRAFQTRHPSPCYSCVCGELPLIIQRSLGVQCTYDTAKGEEPDPGRRSTGCRGVLMLPFWILVHNCNTLADESIFFQLSALPAQLWTFSTRVALFKAQIGCYPSPPLPSITACLTLEYSHLNTPAAGSWYTRTSAQGNCSCHIW